MKMRRTLLVFLTLAFGFTLSSCKSCTEQHNPRPVQEQFKQEMAFSQDQQKLTPEGTIPAPQPKPGDSSAPVSVGQAKFELYCAACHGVNGKADAPGSLAMNPKPRNFTDTAWQGKVDDAHITLVVTKGGPSVGLSATMPAWGAALSPTEVTEVVKYVRTFKGK